VVVAISPNSYPAAQSHSQGALGPQPGNLLKLAEESQGSRQNGWISKSPLLSIPINPYTSSWFTEQTHASVFPI
jgi:hypothetical protein